MHVDCRRKELRKLDEDQKNQWLDVTELTGVHKEDGVDQFGWKLNNKISCYKLTNSLH